MRPIGHIRCQRPVVALLYKALALSISGSAQAFLLRPLRQGVRPACKTSPHRRNVADPDDQPANAG